MENVANLTCRDLAKLASHSECEALISEYCVVKEPKRERKLSLTHNSPSKKISFKTVSKLKVVAHRKVNRWEQYLDKQSGYYYYYNSVTGETRWEAPAKYFAAGNDEEKEEVVEEKKEEDVVEDSKKKESDTKKESEESEAEKKLRIKYVRMAEDYANQQAFKVKEKEDGEEEKQTVCTVCQMGVVTRKFMPCEHLCCCNDCIVALEIEGSEMECPCPLCMMPIERVVDMKKKQPKKEKLYGPSKPLPEGFAEKFKKWGSNQ
jgi:hypothetical protein